MQSPKIDPPTYQVIRLPDLRTIFSILSDSDTTPNPNYAEVSPEAHAWIRTHTSRVYGPTMTIFTDRCKFELFAAYCFPYVNKDGLRVQMDLVNLLWFYDGVTDVQSGEEAMLSAMTAVRAFKEPDFNDGSFMCEMIQDFRRLYLDGKRSPEFISRFIGHFKAYADITGSEAAARENHETLGLTEYITFRRELSATRCLFDFVEYALGLELPGYVFEDPVWSMGYKAALDITYITNDVHSFDMEQGMGHGGSNIISAVMKSRKLDIQAAMDYVGGYCEALVIQLRDATRHLSAHSGPILSNDATRVLKAFGALIKGQELWDFKTERFFGAESNWVRESGVFELRQKFGGYPLGV